MKTVSGIDFDIEKLQSHASEASNQVRNLFVTYIVFAAYLSMVLGATSDKDILLALRLPLPLVGVELPLDGIYFAAPLLFLLLHLHLLLQMLLLARKFHHLDVAIAQISSPRMREQHRDSANQFIFSQALTGTHLDPSVRFMLAATVFSFVFLLPILLLVGFQIRFLPSHDISFTTWHRLVVLLDCLFAVFVIIHIRRLTSAIGRGFVTAFVTAVIGIVFCSWFVCVIPSERNEIKIFQPFVKAVFGPDLVNFPEHWNRQQDTPLLESQFSQFRRSLLHRNLQVPGEALVRRAPSDNILAAYIAQGRSPADSWREQSQALDLSGRDLRFANFRNARMPRIRLSGSDLSGANLSRAHMEEADLTDATLVGATLDGATLVKANLNNANLVGASLYQVNLRGAILTGANMAATNVVESHFVGASLAVANLSAALISNSSLYGVRAPKASFNGAVLSDVILTGAFLEGAKFGGVDLGSKHFEGTTAYYADFRSIDFSIPPAQFWDALEDAIVKHLPSLGAGSGFDVRGRALEKISKARNRKVASFNSLIHDHDVILDRQTIEAASSAGIAFFQPLERDIKSVPRLRTELQRQLARSVCHSADEATGIVLRIVMDDDLPGKEFSLVVHHMSDRKDCPGLVAARAAMSRWHKFDL